MKERQEKAVAALLISPHQKQTYICRASVLIGSPSNLKHIWFLIAFFALYYNKYSGSRMPVPKFFAWPGRHDDASV